MLSTCTIFVIDKRKNMVERKQRRSSKKAASGDGIGKKLLSAVLIAVVAICVWLFGGGASNSDNAVIKRIADNAPKTDADVLALMEVKTPDGLTQQLVAYDGYTSSFNATLHIPNYVVYELTRQETQGAEPRYDKFLCDENVEGCPTTEDYVGSGYDRGHMAPAADMKWSKRAMQQSFYLTNICPQNHSLNSGGWKRLEEKVRLWADRDSALVVVSGPLIEGKVKRLDSGVAVPTGFFKVLLAPFAQPMRAIAFVYKNEGGQKVIEKQAVCVDKVESLTGFDFFSSLPDNIENKIEKSCDYSEWNN